MPRIAVFFASCLLVASCSSSDAPAGGGSTANGPIVRKANPGCFQFAVGMEPPATLSTTGCFADLASHTVIPEAIPYSINSVLWSDGASKERYLLLPSATSTITLPAATDSHLAVASFELPDGAILIKNFSLDLVTAGAATPTTTIVETRFLVKRSATSWEGYSYQWNATHDDATLQPANSQNVSYMVAQANGTTGAQDYYYPARSDCLTCHSTTAGFALGLRLAQLERKMTYPSGELDQLTAWSTSGLFSGPLPTLPPAMPTPLDTSSGTLDARARSYLQANCAHCHQPAAIGAIMDLRFDTLLGADSTTTNTQCVDTQNPSAADPDLPASPTPKRIVPGSHVTSMLWQRPNRRGAGQMPQIASNVIDAQGVALLGEWIDSLTPAGCN